MSMKLNKMPKSNVVLNPFFSCSAVAIGKAIKELMTKIPTIRIDTEIVAATKTAKI